MAFSDYKSQRRDAQRGGGDEKQNQERQTSLTHRRKRENTEEGASIQLAAPHAFITIVFVLSRGERNREHTERTKPPHHHRLHLSSISASRNRGDRTRKTRKQEERQQMKEQRRRRIVHTRIERKGESETKKVAEGKRETSPDQSTDHPQLRLHLQAAAPGTLFFLYTALQIQLLRRQNNCPVTVQSMRE